MITLMARCGLSDSEDIFLSIQFLSTMEEDNKILSQNDKRFLVFRNKRVWSEKNDLWINYLIFLSDLGT